MSRNPVHGYCACRFPYRTYGAERLELVPHHGMPARDANPRHLSNAVVVLGVMAPFPGVFAHLAITQNA